ncbi:MAG TPA: hypothetical protein VIG98_07410 [Bacillus sp. (in: firmicutes)]
MEIKVMTFNIHHARGIDKQADLYRIAEVIKIAMLISLVLMKSINITPDGVSMKIKSVGLQNN